MTTGVPQGSVLGPYMFLEYMNDINDSIETESYMKMFADDTRDAEKITNENSCLEFKII